RRSARPSRGSGAPHLPSGEVPKMELVLIYQNGLNLDTTQSPPSRFISTRRRSWFRTCCLDPSAVVIRFAKTSSFADPCLIEINEVDWTSVVWVSFLSTALGPVFAMASRYSLAYAAVITSRAAFLSASKVL